MGQVTLSWFRGDMAFSFFSRVFSTFMGGVIGMVMWSSLVIGCDENNLSIPAGVHFFYECHDIWMAHLLLMLLAVPDTVL